MIERIAVLAALTGCLAYEPDVGAKLAGSCDDTDSDPEVDVSFAVHIRPLLVRMDGGCSCHLPTSGGGLGTGTVLSGLDLGSMASLRRGGLSSGGRIVVADEPCSSVLYLKVSDTPPYGSRMPLGGVPMNPDELRLLHDWIAEGAADN
jgi:hypothetical protein